MGDRRRHVLPSRRQSMTTTVVWSPSPGGPGQKLVVTFGFDDAGQLREAFCASFRAGSSLVALANDACILLSRLLQHGDSINVVSRSLGENREEGAALGPPSSLVGAIARKAVEVSDEYQALLATVRRADKF